MQDKLKQESSWQVLHLDRLANILRYLEFCTLLMWQAILTQVNRLLYRSKQRGFLEMDLLLGLWAKEHVPQASEPLLAAFEVPNMSTS